MLKAEIVYRIEDPDGRQWPDEKRYFRSRDEAETRAYDAGITAGARLGYLRASPWFVAEIRSETGESVFVSLGRAVTVV